MFIYIHLFKETNFPCLKNFNVKLQFQISPPPPGGTNANIGQSTKSKQFYIKNIILNFLYKFR